MGTDSTPAARPPGPGGAAFVVEWETRIRPGRAFHSGARPVNAPTERQAIRRAREDIASTFGVDQADVVILKVSGWVR